MDLAERVGMKPSKLCRIEKGRSQPTEPEVGAIAKALGFSMQDFYGPLEETPAEETT